MAAKKTQGECSKCLQLEKRIAELEEKIAKLSKNSSNSSKPSSSDIYNPPKKKKPGRPKKRKIGGQPGHPRHQRPAFPEDQIDNFWEYRAEVCPCCSGQLKDDLTLEPKKLQQIELLELPILIEEHHRVGQRCIDCDRIHFVAWPEDLIKAGLVGPRLTAFIGFLKGACHMSFSTMRKFLRDTVGVTLSRGQLRKLIGKVSDSLGDPYEELLRLLPRQDRLNVDETGHKDNGQKMWTWCFRAAMFTLFKISPSRGSGVLVDVLGEEFDGVIGCDYYGAYRKYMRLHENVLLQFCMAHLIRDVKFLVEHPNKKNQAYGKQLLEHLRKLFRTIHRRDEYKSEETFRQALKRIEVDMTWDATVNPETNEAFNMAERFIQHGESYFRFITTPGIEPTNNLAEQAIRFVAIDRRITQGTRGKSGQTWCERIWTAVATCEGQGRSLFDFLCESVMAYFQGTTAPTLVHDTS